VEVRGGFRKNRRGGKGEESLLPLLTVLTITSARGRLVTQNSKCLSTRHLTVVCNLPLPSVVICDSLART
jgi:hypothetical protein